MAILTLLAKLTARPGCEDKLFPELEAMVKPSRSEEGCMKYVLHRTPSDSRTFWFIEEWKNEAALDEHNQTPHYLQLKERTADLVENVELVRLYAVD